MVSLLDNVLLIQTELTVWDVAIKAGLEGRK